MPANVDAAQENDKSHVGEPVYRCRSPSVGCLPDPEANSQFSSISVRLRLSDSLCVQGRIVNRAPAEEPAGVRVGSSHFIRGRLFSRPSPKNVLV